MQIADADADELAHANPGGIEQLDHRAIAEPERRRHIRLRDQRVDLRDREELRQRGPGARRLQIVGGIAMELPIDDEKPVEPAHRRDHARHRPRREAARHLLAHECLERRAIERVDAALARGGERRQRREIASVALERVRGEPALDA